MESSLKFKRSRDGCIIDFRACGSPKVAKDWLDTVENPQDVQELFFGHAHLNEEAFSAIRRLTNLRVLEVRTQSCRDEWLVHLQPLKKLERLNFTNCRISDDAIRAFRKLPALKLLIIRGTRMTAEGRALLKQEFGPSLRILGNA